MSLSIDTRRISSVYALGQWFRVKVNTFCIDAYELMDIEESCPFGNEYNNPHTLLDDPREPHVTYYLMGGVYKKYQPEQESFAFDSSARRKIVSLSSNHGVCFIDEKTNETVYFALMEIKAFKCLPINEVIKKCPALMPQKEALRNSFEQSLKINKT